MMKFYLTILLALWMFACQAQIIQVNNMKEVFDSLDEAHSQTLVIFDIDMVLVQPSDPAFQMANMKRYSSVAKRIMKELPSDKLMLFLSLMSTSSDPVLVDAQAPEYLQQLAHKNISMMAMTANLTGEFNTIKCLEKWRIDSLQKLGIDFCQSAPYQANFVLDHFPTYRGNYSTYLDGILFVNGSHISKGEALLAFLEKAQFSPSKVVFLDDREDNLKSVEAALQKLDSSIEYVGVHFLGALSYPSKPVSEEEFECKWQKLAEEAKQLN